MKTIINHIKSLTLSILMVIPLGAVLCSCSDEPFFSATEDDYPVILNTNLQESWEGQPPVLKTIPRSENFTFDVTVTPAHYTTVTWLIDGVQVAEGTSIDISLLAGEYNLRILATTTKGQQTYRDRRIVVTPLDGDPVVGNDIHERLVKQGTQAQLSGQNLSQVTKVLINGQDVNAVYDASSGSFSYTVPDMPDGIYYLTLQDETGFEYGGGKIELNQDPVYPVEGGEQTVWEGSFDVTWGTPFNEMQNTMINMIEPGDILRVYVTGQGQGCAASAWWRNIVTGYSDDDEGRGDTPISGDMVLEYTINELSIQLLQEQEGFYMVGDGYTVKKITVEKPMETTLWEGSFDVTWGTPFNGLQAELINLVKAGGILRLYVTGQGQGCAATAWWRNIVTGYSDDDEGRGDTPISGDMVLEYTLTDLSIQLLQEQEGFYAVGDGYTLKKITFEN